MDAPARNGDMISKHLLLSGMAVSCGLFATGNSIFAQDTAFTYQGRLRYVIGK